jgi:murein DD-endopeptidase MepM/ murein hydrolase activator NlpD
MRPAELVTLAALVVLAGCKNEPAPPRVLIKDGTLGAQRCSSKAGPKNPTLKVLQRPFDGQFPVYFLFDHDFPTQGEIHPFSDGDTELTYCGIEALGLANGYPGYAFGTPEGTPVLSAAPGEVIFAGPMPTFMCPFTKKLVNDQLAVDVRHDALGGVGFITRYVHLSKVVVKTGEQVVAGQRLGVSGHSGCTTGDLLFFEVKRLTGTKTGTPTVVDPYGWDGPGKDPWAEHERGAESQYLWMDGEAPTLKAK